MTRLIVLMVVPIALTVVGCAHTVSHADPQAGNTGIVRAARQSIVQALNTHDWRIRAGAAMYALRTMGALVPPVTGMCAEFVARTFDELLDLRDAYRGEDFGPLARIVASDPSLSTVCPEGVR